MNRLHVINTTVVLLGLALTSTAVAQSQDFPRNRTSAASCNAVDWNQKMRQFHPALITACREVIEVNGVRWARFDAGLVRVEEDGNVVFSIRDARDRSVEELTFQPVPGQVAYINDRPVPYRELRTTDTISLYVPEGQYGFATMPGAPPEQVAEIVEPVETTAPASAEPASTPEAVVAQRDPSPAMLPSTAGPLPWLALSAFVSLLGGLGLMLRRLITRRPV